MLPSSIIEHAISSREPDQRWSSLDADSYPEPSRYLSIETSSPVSSVLRSFTERAIIERELWALEEQLVELSRKLEEAQATAREKDKLVKERDDVIEKLESKIVLRYILDRVSNAAAVRLCEGGDLLQHFESEERVESFVMSVDIRRSTDLMLKAREPRQFAEFIALLCKSLRHIVLDNMGVFDKFTGDGILAYFPAFYSGRDAAYRVIRAAEQCHAIFEELYRSHRSCFTSVICDTGLGIGIDHGMIQLVRVGEEMTVVGHPVVYACRLSGADAGETLLNQGARDKVFGGYSSLCDLLETSLPFKHEGEMLAYRVQLNGKQFEPEIPDWLTGKKRGQSKRKGKRAKKGKAKQPAKKASAE